VGLRDRLRRLMREAESGGFVLRLTDGTSKVFDDDAIRGQLFLEMIDVLHAFDVPDLSDGPREPEVRDPASPHVSELRAALSKATPESLRRFEERYAPMEHECGVVHEDGRVEYARLRPALQDGSGDELDRCTTW
jgi:hypothetical protein